MAINSGQIQQASPFERLLNATQGVVGVANAFQERSARAKEMEAMERKQAEELTARDPNSEESKIARETYKQVLGSPIAESVSRYTLERNYGPLAKIAEQSRGFTNQKELKAMDGQNALAIAASKMKNEKKIPAGEAVNTAGSTYASQSLDDVVNLVNKNTNTFGPIAGTLAEIQGKIGIGESGRDAASINAVLKQRAQVIGKYLEGGKLTDSDIERYVQSLPQLSDSPEVAKNKVSSLQRLIAQKQAAELDTLQAAGYDVGGIQRAKSVPGLPDVHNVAKEGGLPNANAGPFKITENDYKALAAASARLRSNPNDPDALEAMQHLRSIGLVR